MTRNAFQRWLMFASAVGIVAALWMIVLPRVGEIRAVQTRIEFLESRGIDPSALYYTDLEAMSRLEASVAAKRSRAPHTFWMPHIQE